MGSILQSFLNTWFYYAVPIFCVCVWYIIAKHRIKWLKDDEQQYQKESRNTSKWFWRFMLIIIMLNVVDSVIRRHVGVLDMLAVSIWFAVDLSRWCKEWK